MNVSKQFHDDFDFLARYFGWTIENGELEEMRTWIKSTPAPNMPYITQLAASWRIAEGIA
jgi:hypothetical protein